MQIEEWPDFFLLSGGKIGKKEKLGVEGVDFAARNLAIFPIFPIFPRGRADHPLAYLTGMHPPWRGP
jgi:hypothetical protein